MPIAVTMGDGAGIGPEIVVAALNDDRPETVVIGDRKRLEQAARILGVRAAAPTSSTSSCCPTTCRGASCPRWPATPRTATSSAPRELAMAGEVDAICTAPLNKEALHAAGHSFPGHTELLAHLTGTDEVSMMLSTPKVKVIHVTTHIGLIDAIAQDRARPGGAHHPPRPRRALGPNPKIGVCAINPHAGENGLFGHGEEERRSSRPSRSAARRRHRRPRPAARRHRVLPRRPRRLRPGRGHVPRPGPRPGQGARASRRA